MRKIGDVVSPESQHKTQGKRSLYSAVKPPRYHGVTPVVAHLDKLQAVKIIHNHEHRI
jgi:hypothetical protein